MVSDGESKQAGGRYRRSSVASRLSRAPETARFLRRAAPAFFHEIARDYHRESEDAPQRPRPDLWPKEGLHAAWLGHSTVLLQIDGVTVLTDPVFSLRVGLGFGPVTVGIKRLINVALERDQLPSIDLLLISHAHMDHFDLPSLRALENRQTEVVTARDTATLMRRTRYRAVHELRWEESVAVGPLSITAFEVEHWGARMRSDVFRGYNGYLLESENYCVVFGGDTAYTKAFANLRPKRVVDAAIMPIGAYDPWIHVHCTPEQALAMANDAGARYILPVHHQTFKLGREEREDPIARLEAAMQTENNRIGFRRIGDEFHLDADGNSTLRS